MSLITPPTQAERIRAFKLAMVAEVAEAVNHTASVVRNVNAWLWSQDTATILAILNADLGETTAMLQGSFELALQLNASADSAATTVINADGSPRFTARAPLERGRPDIVFDEPTSQWVCLPPPAIEESPIA